MVSVNVRAERRGVGVDQALTLLRDRARTGNRQQPRAGSRPRP